MPTLIAEAFDHETGITRRMWLNEGTREVTIETVQDVDALLDLNHELSTLPQTGDLRHVANIPVVLKRQWQTAHLRGEGPAPWEGEDWERFKKRMLNDLDYRRLRTGGGRL